MSVSGWYPDPAGTPQLRFWDGQSWTTNLAPLPVAQQPAYQPVAQQPAYQPTFQPAYAPQQMVVTPYVSPRPVGRGNRSYGWIAGGVAAAIAAVVVIPMAFGHHAPTSAAFSRVLLSVAQVNTAGGASFTITPEDDSDNNDDSSADCPGVDTSSKASSTPEKASASREFTAEGQGEFVSEHLAYEPGKATSDLATIRQQVGKCKSLTIDGKKLTFTVLSAPVVPGSDDTFGMQLSRTESGQTIVIDEEVARFGDSLVGIVVAGRGEPEIVQSVTTGLLNQAAIKAKSVF